jgi:hypothetical protein
MKLKDAQRQQARQIATELAAIARSADVLPGTITERLTRCGRPNCACKADPPRRHGPYWHWTRKIKNKTVGGYLNKSQANDCEHWIANDRRLRELIAALETIGIERLEAEQRQS